MGRKYLQLYAEKVSLSGPMSSVNQIDFGQMSHCVQIFRLYLGQLKTSWHLVHIFVKVFRFIRDQRKP